MNLLDPQKPLRFDFFVTCIGMILLYGFLLYHYVQPVDSQNFQQILLFVGAIGFFLTFYGMTKLSRIYREEIYFGYLTTFNQQMEEIKDLEKHGLINAHQKELAIGVLRGKVNKYLENELFPIQLLKMKGFRGLFRLLFLFILVLVIIIVILVLYK